MIKLKNMTDTETAIQTILNELEIYENQNNDEKLKNHDLALQIYSHLSILKLLIGNDKFNDLPYFYDKLMETKIITNEYFKKEYGDYLDPIMKKYSDKKTVE